MYNPVKCIMYNPVNPSLLYKKWGLKGSKSNRYVFVMALVMQVMATLRMNRRISLIRLCKHTNVSSNI